ncbi:unnamed protein product [Wuchereria bancrofti]|uniref:DUF19 domain-containing protein n=1 Tax=Wuchereria bancrofti TaxID=6293 RepID=A0A3P7GG87_WUCBA|nr:unnamed protein product [Wuchereria bancrofti]
MIPFLDKFNFEQLFFEKSFADAQPILCNLYSEYKNCTSDYDCRTLNDQSDHFLIEICSSSLQKQLREHHACFNNFGNYFIYSPECFDNSLHSNQETTLFQSEYEHNKIEERKCRIVQWYLNCNLTNAYSKTCPDAAQIMRRYYELLLNSNQNPCDLRKLNFNLSGLNLTDSGNITQLGGNSSKINDSLGDLLNPKNKNINERCHIASERYVVEAARQLRKYEYLAYQLFRIPFNQLIERTSCLDYEIYKKNVQGISPQCRKMNTHLEKIYDYYCSNSFINSLLNQESCIEKLHSICNESQCSNVDLFSDGYNSLFKTETILNQKTSGFSSQRCEFAKRYLGCGITESFYEMCPKIAEAVQNYFETLINANNSNCYLRQPAADIDETVFGRSIRQPTVNLNETDLNETVPPDWSNRQPIADLNETFPLDWSNRQPTADLNETVPPDWSNRQPTADLNESISSWCLFIIQLLLFKLFIFYQS